MRIQLHAGRFDGLDNPDLVWTALVRIKRSELVNLFEIGTNRKLPYLTCFALYLRIYNRHSRVSAKPLLIVIEVFVKTSAVKRPETPLPA